VYISAYLFAFSTHDSRGVNVLSDLVCDYILEDTRLGDGPKYAVIVAFTTCGQIYLVGDP
jgi:hypothetical protein